LNQPKQRKIEQLGCFKEQRTTLPSLETKRIFDGEEQTL